MPLLGVVFDFDGVIADTEALHLRAYQETLAERGLSLSKTEYFERYLGYDDVGVVTAVGRDHGVIFENSEITQLIETKGHRFESLVGAAHLPLSRVGGMRSAPRKPRRGLASRRGPCTPKSSIF